MKNIRFVSYTGKYPEYCSGVLTLMINGKEVRFGHNFSDPHWNTDGNHISFWYPGNNGGEWKIDPEQIPEKYRQFSSEIDHVFNTNVKHGCCGGCKRPK